MTMKNILLSMLFSSFLFIGNNTAQQTQSFYVLVSDSAYLPNQASTTLQFNNPVLNQLKQAYGITKMTPAYPDANYLFLRWVYTIECSNDSLMIVMKDLNPSKIKVIGKPHIGVLQCNHPNDYGLVYLGKQVKLDFITIAAASDLAKLDPIKNISYLS